MSISTIGVGSGLELGALVDRLIQVERDTTEKRLNLRQEEAQARISAFGALSSMLSTVGASLNKLSSLGEGRRATSSDQDKVRAEATSQASLGRYFVNVEQLARAETRVSQTFTDAKASLGTGSISLTVGGTTRNIDITSSNNTLEGVRNAINDAKVGVQAAIIKDGDSFRLMLSANSTGEANSITFAVNPAVPGTSGDVLGALVSLANNDNVEDEGYGRVMQAQDAVIRLNGVRSQNANNRFDSLIQGVTFDARAETAANQPVVIDIARDRDAITKEINAFVAAYNNVVDLTGQLTKFDEEKQEGALLIGDATVRGIRSRLSNIIGQRGADPNSSFSALVDLGIRSDEKGRLSVDSGRLNQAMDRDLDGVLGLVNAFSKNMNGAVNDFTRRNGLLDNRTQGLRANLDQVQQQRDRLELRLERMEERLVRQFGNLDILVGQLQNTSQFLQQQFSALNSIMEMSPARRRR